MRKRLALKTGGTLLLGLCPSAFAASGSVEYTITEIPLVSGDTVGYADGINDSGQVVGFCSQVTDPRFGPRNAYLYSNGQLSTLGISAGTDSQAIAINDSGLIVGQENSIAFVDNVGQFTNISPGGAGGYADSINNAGQVTGYFDVSSSSYHAFLYNSSGNSLADLNPAGWNDSSGAKINSNGQIVGSLYSPGNDSFLYSNGKLTDLTASISGLYEATAINDSGEIAGYETSGEGFYYKGTGLIPFGNVPGYPTELPSAINDEGVIVGTLVSLAQVQQALIFSSGTLTNLNTLINPSSGWTLQSAEDINNLGQIVGQGIDRSGNERGYMLTPISVPEPASLALLGIGAATCATRRSRSRAAR